MQAAVNTRYFQFFKAVRAVRRIPRGAEMDLVPGEKLRIEAIRPDVVRLKISAGGAFDDPPTFAVCADLPERVEHDLVETPEAVELVTAQVRLRVRKDPLRIDALRPDGSVIFRNAPDRKDHTRAFGVLNDDFVLHRACAREDAFLGLGEKTGRMNRRWRRYKTWNLDVHNAYQVKPFIRDLDPDDPARDYEGLEFDPYYVSIPFFYHLDGQTGHAAGFFFDNGYPGNFDFAEPDQYTVHFEGGQYTEYVFAGPAIADVLKGYMWLTGHMKPPPLWALGHHQCRWYRYSQETFLELARTYRRKGIPCDVVWLDIDYMDEYRVFTWNHDLFPDPQAMLRTLRDEGFRTITIIDPGVKLDPDYRVYQDGLAKDVFCKCESGAPFIGQVWPEETLFPDFVREEARHWWGRLNARHVQSGLAGIWNDMNEPATGAIEPHRMRFDDGRYSHDRYHNQYALLMAMGTVDGLLEAMPDLRTFVLSRAGFSGLQRYAANWMGDNFSRWGYLWQSMPMALGLGLSGQPFVGADIGGFAGQCHGELLARWYQAGALTPFCRNHASDHAPDQYPWSFGEAVERICREAIELRYRLMPYIYTAFMQSCADGLPVQRPLVLDCQYDRAARDVDDEYLFGPHLLVAPVHEAGTTARQVYLPAGTWHHWHTGEVLEGGRFALADTPMDWIPLYARGGAVIPLWPEAPASTMGHHPEAIDLHVFPPREDGEWTSALHEDDGVTFAEARGQFVRTDLTVRRQGGRLTIEARVSGDGYPEFRRRRFRLVFHGQAPAEVRVGGQARPLEQGSLELENAGESFTLEADLPA